MDKKQKRQEWVEKRLEKMRMDNGDLRIPPMWPIIIVWLIVVGSAAAYLIYYTVTSGSMEMVLPILLLIALTVYILYKETPSYILTEEKIICRRLGKTYRAIPWSQVIQLGVTIRGGADRSRSNVYIIATLEGAEKFDPKKQKAVKYMDEWKDKLLVMTAEDDRIAAFEHFYGKLDYKNYDHE